MSVLGLGDREVLREGIACAVLRRPDHRDTYDAMFDLYFPAALGARTVLSIDDEAATIRRPAAGGRRGDARRRCSTCWPTTRSWPTSDERLAAMIAQIVEAYGRYNSSRGPSYSSYQALKAMSLDELEGGCWPGCSRPYGDEPTPTQEQIAKSIAAQRIAQLRKMVEGETKRRTAEQLGRDHVPDVRRPAAGRERRVPARLRRAAAPDAPCGATAGPHAGDPAGRPPAAVAGRARSTCARRCASRCPPVGCRSTWC